MLILGKTRCIISNKIIYRESHATRLPYVQPESINFMEVGKEKLLQFSTRPYVLRDEWTNWVYKNQFSQAAFLLKLNFLKLQDFAEVFLGSSDHFILSKISNQDLIILEDFDGLFRLDMSSFDFYGLKNFLQIKEKNSLTLGDYVIIYDFKVSSIIVAISEMGGTVKIFTYDGQSFADIRKLIETANVSPRSSQNSSLEPTNQMEM